MTRAIKKDTDPAILKHIDRCAVFLVKTLCLDTNATEATVTQTITITARASAATA